jgi:preprotein translocase YajC subunit
MMVISSRKNKRSQQEYVEQLAAIKPGNKVKTAGGICGIVVEVCDEDNTVIIETGSEKSGKSYIKMDKELIAQTDAKGATQLAREAAEAAKRAQEMPEEAATAEESEEAPAAEESEEPQE